MSDARTETQAGSVAPSALLLARLAAVRRKQVSVAIGAGAAIAFSVMAVLLATAMLLDWWLDLPLGVRAVLLCLWVAGTAAIVWRHIVRPIRNQPDDDSVALAIEKAFPQFRSRLISSIQLARPGRLPPNSATSLVRMTIAETETLAGPMDFTTVVQTRELRRMSMIAVGVAALALFAFLYGGEVSRDLLKRAFLSRTPVPRHTRVELLTGDRTVGRGDTVRIEAIARGVVPRKGTLVVRSAGRRTQEFTMEKDREGRFSRALENVQQTFSYVVQLNDGTTRSHQIEVVPRPSVASIVCEQAPPPYTGLKAVQRSLGDLTLLAGSKLRIAATATKEVATGFIRLVGITNDIPMQVAANKRDLRGEFDIPAKGLTGFSIEMVDTGGMESRDSAVYRIDILPDRAPKVRITYPDRKEELVTRYALVDVAFEAGDDFRISKAQLRYKVGETETAEITSVDLAIGTNVVREMRNRYEWRIRDFQPALTEGTRIEYWLEVHDNNNVTGPGIGITEHQLLRVVSENEKRADLLNRAGDFLGTISDVTGDQEKLNLRLGEIILEKKPAAP